MEYRLETRIKDQGLSQHYWSSALNLIYFNKLNLLVQVKKDGFAINMLGLWNYWDAVLN
jgi:hypothetical protein